MSTSPCPILKEEAAAAALKAELTDLLENNSDLQEPNRGDLSAATASGVAWRYGTTPDYTLANLRFLQGKSASHAAMSMERKVEDFVKTWEMEASHKSELGQWTTVNHARYNVQTNDGEVLDGEEVFAMGNYNALLAGCKANPCAGSKDFEESHRVFRNVFTDAFSWELLELRADSSGRADVVLFSWRHWGNFDGSYLGRAGDGTLVEMFGVCRVGLKPSAGEDEGLKIESLKVYMDGDAFLARLSGEEGVVADKEEALEATWKRAAELWKDC